MFYFLLAIGVGVILYSLFESHIKTRQKVFENERLHKENEERQSELSKLDDFIEKNISGNNHLDPVEFHFRFLPIDFKELEYTVIDFETANRNPLSAISLGIAHFKGSLLLSVHEFRFSPIIAYPWEFEHIHNISIDQAKSNEKFEQQWEKIHPHLNRKLLVAHNADFDIEVLKSQVSFIKQKLEHIRVACTYKLAKRFMRYENSYSLENLCKSNNIPYWSHKAAHDAVSAGILFMKAISEGTIPSVVESAMRGKKVAVK